MMRASSTSDSRSRPARFVAGGQLEHAVVEAGRDQIILQRALVLQVLLGLAARHLVERRLRDIEVAAVDQFDGICR